MAAAAAAPVSLGTSNLRASSARQTRTNPTRTSKTAATVLRQNSLGSHHHASASGPTAAAQGAPDQPHHQHGFYPAIQHFTDAVAALPRDYRRHVSLLKEVDAKAFSLEADLQHLLTQCTAYTSPSEPATRADDPRAPSAAGDADAHESTAAGTAAAAAPADTRRRQVFHNLRATLMQIMVTMDEKNHVINNANEELSRHLRRFHNIWPHVANEISEEAMLGSLKHWAYTDTNPSKKSTATSRREAAANNSALLHESDIAQRSESRREAVAAKSKKNLARLEAGYADIGHTGKKTAAEKRRAAEADDLSGLGITGPFRGKKAKTGNAAAVDKAAHAGIAMSREPSQQDGGGSKKRKAPAATGAVARKRINANQDSPKLAQAPVAAVLGKEPYKRSPALAAARPATSRGRQNSLQTGENSSNNAAATAAATTTHARGRPQTSSARNGVTASTLEQHAAGSAPAAAAAAAAAATAAVGGKAGNDAKSSAKEGTTGKGIDEETTQNGGNSDVLTRGAASMERTASKQGASGRDVSQSARPSDSPQLGGAVVASRGRTSKISTPVIGSLAEGESSSGGTAENGGGGGGGGNSKSKRPARPRVKDHGLHDSLSPKGLPLKRSHKKGGSMASQPSAHQQAPDGGGPGHGQNPSSQQRGVKPEVDSIPADDFSEEPMDDLLEDEKYCYCGGPSYGEMIACDNPKCPGEWFHLECIGLKNAPKSEKWFCEDCKEKVVGKRNGNGR